MDSQRFVDLLRLVVRDGAASEVLTVLEAPPRRRPSEDMRAMSRHAQVLNTAVGSTPLLQLGYTPDSLLAGLADANSYATSFVYDGLDRLSTTTYPDNSTETRTYDAGGNLLSRHTRANQTILFTYDTLN